MKDTEMSKRQVPDDVLESISQKPLSKKSKILDEKPVDQDIVDSMLDVTERSDLRKILNIRNDREIQIKVEVDGDEDDDTEWTDFKVTQADTGRTHKFTDEEDEDEFALVPIVILDDSKEVCFIGDNMLYDIEGDYVALWRNKGDDFDCDLVDLIDDDPGEFTMVFSNYDELEKMVNDHVPKIFINVIQNFKTQYEALPFTVRREWDAHILLMKDLVVKKILEFYRERGIAPDTEITPGTIVTLGNAQIEKIIDESIQEIGSM